jgi:thymidylate kinase
MIVEFAGCSGAGKSTLLDELLRHCRERNLPVLTAPQALLPWIPEIIVRQPTLQNLMLDVAGAFRRIVDRDPYRDFLEFARSAIWRDTDRRLRGLNAYRGVLRVLGIHAALSSEAHKRGIVLVDEGTVNSAHAILVHVKQPPRCEDIDVFCRLVPIPDLVVHVTAPLDVVLARTFARQHPPLPNRSRADRERFIRHAHAAFQGIMSHTAFTRNTLRISCDDENQQQYRFGAREIIEQIA